MSSMLKIGVVCYPTYGGSGVIATELGMHLGKFGHELHFITSSQPVKLVVDNENIFFHEVVFKNYPLFKYDPYEIALTSKIVDVVQKHDLDLLHVHYALPHASAAYLAKQILKSKGIKIPFVTTLHGTDITLVGKDESFEPVISFALNQSDAVTAVSEDLKEQTLSNFDIEDKVEVVPNFVCVDKYKEKPGSDECRKSEFAPNDERILMHISNFRAVKRIVDIIDSFAIVANNCAAKLVLVGDGPERKSVECKVEELGLKDKVLFLGEIGDVEVALCAADIFLLASENESFGLVALEAMAAGVPVVSTNAGGIPEVNLHGKTGLLNNVGDFEQMAKNILEILSNDQMHENMRKQAELRAQELDVSAIAPHYLEIYNRLKK